MAEAPKKFDPKAFNTDPKHEQDRMEFDALIEGSFERILKKRKESATPEDENVFDALGKFIFGK